MRVDARFERCEAGFGGDLPFALFADLTLVQLGIGASETLLKRGDSPVGQREGKRDHKADTQTEPKVGAETGAVNNVNPESDEIGDERTGDRKYCEQGKDSCQTNPKRAVIQTTEDVRDDRPGMAIDNA